MEFFLGVVAGVLVGGLAGVIITRKIFINQIKKNPPINEKMIRAMYSQMGQKPSEAKIRQIMNSMNQYK